MKLVEPLLVAMSSVQPVEYTGKAGGTELRRFFEFVAERYQIYLRKQNGDRWPWTQDQILQSYRFCNVYREHDRTTEWIASYWRYPNEKDPRFWFASAVARRVNLIESLFELGYPVPWAPAHFYQVLLNRKERGQQMFSGAYMITTAGSTKEWAQWQADDVLTPLWLRRNLISTIQPENGLGVLHAALSDHFGFRSGFISAQVVADVKYLPNWKWAPDWMSFAASGPGSRKGLNRVVGRHVRAPWIETKWHECLLKVQVIAHNAPQLRALPERLHAQDLQNCLCEFDKYCRIQEGEKTLRRYQCGTM